jgi:hypothetical protein
MLHACVERFDVMGGSGNILGWDGEVKGHGPNCPSIFLDEIINYYLEASHLARPNAKAATS